MKEITLIVLCAGDSTRFGLQAKKQWLRIGDEPLWLNVTKRISSYNNFDKIIIVGHQNELDYMKLYSDSFDYVAGGSTRQFSIQNALQNVRTPYVMITDVARGCVPQNVINSLIQNISQGDCIVPVLKVSDTVLFQEETINRDQVTLVQTPQLSKTSSLEKALQTTIQFTDDSSAIKAIGGKVVFIEGSLESQKLTFSNDITKLSCITPPSLDYFTGFGIDTHQFEPNKPMVLGGISIESDVGFKAHSDGDVAIHSIIDALLGAIGAGDIGEFFPDTDATYKNADSKKLLEHIVQFVYNVGYEINNIDITILAEIPKINPYKLSMKKILSKIIQIPAQRINIKATTSEKMGFIGRKEGVTVHSVATLKFYDWTKQ